MYNKFSDVNSSASKDYVFSQKNSFLNKEKDLDIKTKKCLNQDHQDAKNYNRSNTELIDNITRFINNENYNSPNLLHADGLQSEDVQELNGSIINNSIFKIFNTPSKKSFTPERKYSLDQSKTTPVLSRNQSVLINNTNNSIYLETGTIEENELLVRIKPSPTKGLDFLGHKHHSDFDENSFGIKSKLSQLKSINESIKSKSDQGNFY